MRLSRVPDVLERRAAAADRLAARYGAVVLRRDDRGRGRAGRVSAQISIPLPRDPEEERQERDRGRSRHVPPVRGRGDQRRDLPRGGGPRQRGHCVRGGEVHGRVLARAQKAQPHRGLHQDHLRHGERLEDEGAVLGGLQQARLQAALRHFRRAARAAEPRSVGRYARALPAVSRCGSC